MDEPPAAGRQSVGGRVERLMSSQTPLGVLKSAVVSGVGATLVTVEVHRDDGIPTETIVGLPGKAVRESLDRIRSACRRTDVYLEPRRTTVNLAPADHPKGGSGLDLPIALGILVADAIVPEERLAGCVCLGELQLDGSVQPVAGVLPAAIEAHAAGLATLIVPRANAAEAAAVDELSTVPVATLAEAIEWAKGGTAPGLDACPPAPAAAPEIDLQEVTGHAVARRALEIAAAGGHHLLMVGLPGAGKTMLARAVPGILPDMSRDEALEASAVYSVVGQLAGRGLLQQRPFRAPHHSVTAAGLIGGGVPPKPGEVTLAHCGVLFLDEFPEFRRSALECLRQPLEEAAVSLVRGGRHALLPARFQLIAAMNPCPCGQGAQSDKCRCTVGQIRGYWRRLSSPLLDRIDIVLAVEPVPLGELIDARPRSESSKEVRKRVTEARTRQQRRLRRVSATNHGDLVTCNATLPTKLLERMCRLSAANRRRARDEAQRLEVSARGWHRVLRVARTIADLAGREQISYADVAEAFQYRQRGQEMNAAAARFTVA